MRAFIKVSAFLANSTEQQPMYLRTSLIRSVTAPSASVREICPDAGAEIVFDGDNVYITAESVQEILERLSDSEAAR